MSYREYTVCPWGIGYEVMVHVDTGTGELLRAYTYEKDVQELLAMDAEDRHGEDSFKRRHVGRMSKNKLFRNLTKAFLVEFKAAIDEAVSDEILKDKEEEVRLQKVLGKSGR